MSKLTAHKTNRKFVVLTALRQDPLALICLLLLSAVVFVGVFAPWLSQYDPVAVAPRDKNLAMSALHWFGTDHLGRDIFTRLIFAVRTSLFYSLLALLATLLLGALVGLTAGILGGKWDSLLMRLSDMVLAFPNEIFILAIIGILGPNVQNIVLAIAITKWAWFAKMLRGLVWQLRDRNYILFAKVIKPSKWNLLTRHFLPNIAADTAILVSTEMSGIILMVSALSFLGLGVQAPTPEWGNMLSEAKNQMLFYPEQMLPAGLTIVLVLICCNVLGDFLRDCLDPAYRTMHNEEKR